MCDIYYHKCAVIGCDRAIEFHIADWDMDRSEFIVYCPAHANLADDRFTKFRVKIAGGGMVDIPERDQAFIPTVFMDDSEIISKINAELKEGDIWAVYSFWARPSYRTGYHPNATEKEMEEIKVELPTMPRYTIEGLKAKVTEQKGEILRYATP